MMPGPVSDSYDPEFGTGANADEVRRGVESANRLFSKLLGSGLRNIVEVAKGDAGPTLILKLTERQARLARFAINRALESL